MEFNEDDIKTEVILQYVTNKNTKPKKINKLPKKTTPKAKPIRKKIPISIDDNIEIPDAEYGRKIQKKRKSK